MRLPDSIQIEKEGYYCTSCFKESIEKTEDGGNIVYLCKACGHKSGRCIVIDKGIVFWVDNARNYWHESVGVIVQRNDGGILCILRRIFPFAYALPAGHINSGEGPVEAAKRELAEETNIFAEKLDFHSTFDIPNDSCRRGSDHHRWHLFRYSLPDGVEVKISDEAKSFFWVHKNEFSSLTPKTYPLSFIQARLGNSFFTP